MEQARYCRRGCFCIFEIQDRCQKHIPNSEPRTAVWWKCPSPSPPAGVEEPSPPVNSMAGMFAREGWWGGGEMYGVESRTGIGRENLGLVPAWPPGAFIHLLPSSRGRHSLIGFLSSWLSRGPSRLGFGFVFPLFWPPLALANTVP